MIGSPQRQQFYITFYTPGCHFSLDLINDSVLSYSSSVIRGGRINPLQGGVLPFSLFLIQEGALVSFHEVRFHTGMLHAGSQQDPKPNSHTHNPAGFYLFSAITISVYFQPSRSQCIFSLYDLSVFFDIKKTLEH